MSYSTRSSGSRSRSRSRSRSPSASDASYSDASYSGDDYDSDEEADAAAARIQAQFRGNQARKELREREEAALKIQAVRRGQQARQEMEEQKQAAAKIQAGFRGKQARKEVEQLREFNATYADAGEDEHDAAAKIQAGFRGKKARQEMKEQDEAAAKIQAGFRGKKARQELQEQEEAAAKIQAGFRGKKTRQELQEKEEAAAKIQAGFRGKKARQELAEQEEAAAKIQAGFRGKKAREEVNQMREEQQTITTVKVRTEVITRENPISDPTAEEHAAAVKLQALQRGRKARAEVKEMKKMRVRGTRVMNKKMAQLKLRADAAEKTLFSTRRMLRVKEKEVDALRQQLRNCRAQLKRARNGLPINAGGGMRDDNDTDYDDFQAKMRRLQARCRQTVHKLTEKIKMLTAQVQETEELVQAEVKRGDKLARERGEARKAVAAVREEVKRANATLAQHMENEQALHEEREALQKRLDDVTRQGQGQAAAVTKSLDVHQREMAAMEEAYRMEGQDLRAKLVASEQARWAAALELGRLRTEMECQGAEFDELRLQMANQEDELAKLRKRRWQGDLDKVKSEEAVEALTVANRGLKREVQHLRRRLQDEMGHGAQAMEKAATQAQQALNNMYNAEGVMNGVPPGDVLEGNPYTAMNMLSHQQRTSGRTARLASLPAYVTPRRDNAWGGADDGGLAAELGIPADTRSPLRGAGNMGSGIPPPRVDATGGRRLKPVAPMGGGPGRPSPNAAKMNGNRGPEYSGAPRAGRRVRGRARGAAVQRSTSDDASATGGRRGRRGRRRR